MRPQYYHIKECLHVLQEGPVFGGTQKYKTEILLLQVLRLTLKEDVEPRVFADLCSEESTKALLNDLKVLCNSVEYGELAARFHDRVREFALPIQPLVSGQPSA